MSPSEARDRIPRIRRSAAFAIGENCAADPNVGGVRAVAPWVFFVTDVAVAAIWVIAKPVAMPGMAH